MNNSSPVHAFWNILMMFVIMVEWLNRFSVDTIESLQIRFNHALNVTSGVANELLNMAYVSQH